MADNTIILQGKFTADGNAKTIQLRSDVDWMKVYNWTQAATQQSTGRGVEFFWQRGMTADTGIEYKKTNSTDALNLVTLSSGGFTLINSTTDAVTGSPVAITAVSTAATPVVSTGTTTGLIAGDTVRLVNVTSAQQLGGIDFTINNISSGVSFDLPYMA